MVKGRMIRVDEKLISDLEDVNFQRRVRGVDRKDVSLRRFTEAITRAKSWNNLKEELSVKKIPRGLHKDLRGGMMSVIFFVIIAFVASTFLALWFYAHNILTTNLLAVPSFGATNITQPVADTFGVVNSAMGNGLALAAFVIIFMQAVFTLVTAYYSNSNPIFYVVHIFMTILAIILSVVVSNAYEELLSNPNFGSTLMDFTGATYVMLNLPLWAGTIGVLSAVLMFVGALRTTNQGGV